MVKTAESKEPKTPIVYQAQIKKAYYQTIRPNLMKELKLNNIHEVPKLEKIILNSGLGRSKSDKRAFDTALNTLSRISGQQPQVTLARMSVASFKLRTGNKIGAMVTLRDNRMYEFLERLITLVMPRLRDFRGARLKSFDKSGHYSIGFSEQSIFPELSFEETSPAHGLQATLVFKSQSPEHNRALLEAFGFKFEKTAVSDDNSKGENHG